jgi:hypothetical protein
MGQGGPAPLIFQAAAMRQQMQKQERENRANDLQQLSGTYNLLKQQEFGRMMQAQQTRTAVCAQSAARTARSAHDGIARQEQPVFGPAGNASATGPAAPTRPATAVAARPHASPPTGAADSLRRCLRNKAPQQSPGLNIGGPAAGIPAQVWLAQDPTGKTYLEQLAKDRAPQNVRPGGTLATMGPDGKFSSAFYAPQLGPGVMPQRGPDGSVSGAAQIPGFAGANADITSARAAAEQRAKQAETYVDVPIGNGQTQRMTQAEYAQRRQQSIPPEVLAADQ